MDEIIGVLNIRTFPVSNDKTQKWSVRVRKKASEFYSKIVIKLKQKPCDKLIVDLRGNKGGFPDVGFLELLLLLPGVEEPQEVLLTNRHTYTISQDLGVHWRYKTGAEGTLQNIANPIKQFINVDIKILVDEETMSMGEIFAYLLKKFRPADTEVISVNSTHTYGKVFGLAFINAPTLQTHEIQFSEVRFGVVDPQTGEYFTFKNDEGVVDNSWIDRSIEQEHLDDKALISLF